MKDKITLEELAPYLPYRLNVYDVKGSKAYELIPYKRQHERLDKKMPLQEFMNFRSKECLLVLRPLSDLTENLVNELLPSMHISKEDIEQMKSTPIGRWKYYQVISAAQMHIDFRGLISKGLAIDINTLDL